MTRKITPPAELAALISAHRAASLDDGRAADLRFDGKLAATFGPFAELPAGTYRVNDDGTLTPHPREDQ